MALQTIYVYDLSRFVEDVEVTFYGCTTFLVP